ncbi:MAG: hypothetical protein AAF841_02465 [Pseudomonadota bacterium]
MNSLADQPVVDAVWRAGGDTIEAATLGYYAILDNDDHDAALAMWIAPDPNKSAFRVIRNRFRSDYRLRYMGTSYAPSGMFATAEIIVDGRNDREPWRRYHLYVHWAKTDFGWLITDMDEI